MKALAISLITILVSAGSFAATFALPDGAIGLAPIQGTVSFPSANMKCPVGVACDPAAIVQLNFKLTGCLNQLGPVNYDVEESASDGKYDVYVSAVEVINKESATARCVAIPMASTQIALGMGTIGKDMVRVHFLKYTAPVR